MPRKLVRRRIRRQFPRILYFSEVYDSSYGDPTGEEEWLAKLYGGRNYAVGKGDKFKWQGQVPRHPPARFIIVSIPCHTLTQFEKKKGGEKCTPWRLCRTTWLVIRRFISGRVRSERDGLIAFRISLTSSTNSPTRAFCLCADTGKNGKSNSSLVYDDRGLVDEFFQTLFIFFI